jgi:hypothetical protein
MKHPLLKMTVMALVLLPALASACVGDWLQAHGWHRHTTATRRG